MQACGWPLSKAPLDEAPLRCRCGTAPLLTSCPPDVAQWARRAVRMLAAYATAMGAAAAAGAAGAACFAMKAANLEERAALSALALPFRRRWKKSSVPSTYAICAGRKFWERVSMRDWRRRACGYCRAGAEGLGTSSSTCRNGNTRSAQPAPKHPCTCAPS